MRTTKNLKPIAAAVILAAALAAGGYWLRASNRNPDAAQAQATPEANHQGHGGGNASEAGGDPAQLVGARTTIVQSRALVKKIRAVGVVAYDERRIASVYAKIDGWIDNIFVDFTGKAVRKGEPLFTLYSPDLVATQEEYLLALRAREALGASSVKEIRAGAESLLEVTRQRLRLWDISEKEIDDIASAGKARRSLTVFSPADGYVVKKDAARGMRVMPDRELYTIVDLSSVWVNAEVYEFEVSQIRVGQNAAVSLSYAPGRTLAGRVAWIAPVLDEKTRTAKIRIELANANLALKPEMYANVELALDGGKKIAVPDEAVLDSGLRKVVFIDPGDGRLAPREVKLGGKYDGYYEVLAGVVEGEKILASAGFLFDSESRLKEAMGAMADTADSKGEERRSPVHQH